MTGKNWEKGEREIGKGEKLADVKPAVSPFPVTLFPQSLRRTGVSCRLRTLVPGFTLLELMIVITIIIILAAIVLPQYQKTILASREAVLRKDLHEMRTLIDQYGADKQKLPQSLDDLVTERYLREIPTDPITGQKDWTVETGEDPSAVNGEQGIVNVHSASPDPSSEGTPYSEW